MLRDLDNVFVMTTGVNEKKKTVPVKQESAKTTPKRVAKAERKQEKTTPKKSPVKVEIKKPEV